MAYGSSLGITLPTVGVSTGPGWATSLNTALTTIIATLEAKVTPASLDINADLSFTSGSTAYRAKDIKAVSLTNQDSSLSAGTYACTLFSTDAAGELYWNDNSGRQIQVTSGGAVNVSSAGGITGLGYGSNSIEVNWDGAQYLLRSGAATDDYASVVANDLVLNDGSGNFVTVASPSLSADYTLTLPSAVPAADNSLLEMATSGAVTTTKTPSVTSLTTSGAITAGSTIAAGTNATVGGTLGVTGNTTLTGTLAVTSTTALSNTLTLASNKDIVLQGTGKIQHGNRVLVVPGLAFLGASTSSASSRNTDGTAGAVTGNILYFPLSAHLPAGTQITSMVWKATHDSVAGSRTYAAHYMSSAGGSPTPIESDGDSTVSGAVTVTTGTDIDMLDSRMYWLSWTPKSGDLLISVTINYNTPA